MLRAVFRAEWRSALRERALFVLLGVFVVLVAYAAVGSRQLTASERVAAEAALSAERERVRSLRKDLEALPPDAPALNADPRDPLAVGRDLLPRAAVLPPAPLGPVAVGQRDLLPQVVELTTRPRFVEAGHDDGSSPTRRALGPFDVAFVIVFLLPLVIVATTYDLLSGERERGTLALVLSQPVSLTGFVLGKATQRAVLLVSAAVATCWAGAWIGGARAASPGAWLTFGALVAVYALFWIALSVAVNAWGRSSAANALALVGAWLTLVIVVPGLGGAAADWLHPTPSRVELVNLARSASSDATARLTAVEGDHGREVTRATGARAIVAQQEVEQRVRPVVRRFREQLTRQQALVHRLGFASPALLLHEGLTDIAGSGVARHQHFDHQVDAFHERWKELLFAKARASAELVASDYDALPTFEYVEETASTVTARVLVRAAGVTGWIVALLLVAWAGLRRSVSRGWR